MLLKGRFSIGTTGLLFGTTTIVVIVDIFGKPEKSILSSSGRFVIL